MRGFLGLIVLVTLLGLGVSKEQDWWQTMSLYHVYPRSFKDSNGDGMGDLNGSGRTNFNTISMSCSMSDVYEGPITADAGNLASDLYYPALSPADNNRPVYCGLTAPLRNHIVSENENLVTVTRAYHYQYGISSKLEHLKASNVDAFWIGPFYPSPGVDSGYDVSDFVGIDPIFGTFEDFENLITKAHALGLKVLMDFVPNGSSNQHEWFQKSIKNIKPYSDYYVWQNGTVQEDGTIAKPNNWASVFGGPAWTWNEERQAFYLHQFAIEQPDFNYENDILVKEIEKIMRFWLDKGIDGFRIDAVPHMCEDQRFLDEPLTGNTDDPNSYGYTDHIYTKGQPRTYEIVKGWRAVLDEYKSRNGQSRIMMIEAYDTVPLTMKYYDVGAEFPFNFWFIENLNKYSTAADFKNVIDQWMAQMPEGSTPNWVAGNHDKPRVRSRFGDRVSQMNTIMTQLLPGAAVTYYGEEIGMVNTFVSWEETTDPQGCNAGIDGFAEASRDPARTPFQWDNTTAAGFSTNSHTWLPVNPNYLELNLAVQKLASDSFYKMYHDITELRKWPAVREGKLATRLINDDIFAFSRQALGQRSVFVIFNFKNEPAVVDLNVFDHVPNVLAVYRTTYQHDAHLVPGEGQYSYSVPVPPLGAVIYVTPLTR